MSLLLTGQESKRLSYRKVRQSDYQFWLPFFSDPQTSKHWTMPEASAEAQCTDWYQYQFYRYEQGLGGMNALIEKNTGQLVGHCGLLVQTVDGQSELEVGYSLLPAFWGKGYATEAAQTCRDHAFTHGLTESLISIISLTNTPSERVARANGMQVIKQTVYHDNPVNIFSIDRADWMALMAS